MKDLKLYIIMLKAAFKSSTLYRVDFSVGMIGALLYNATFLASIGIITSRFDAIGGFTGWEIFFLFGLFMIINAFFHLLLFNMTHIGREINSGHMDILLLRPYGVLMQMGFSKINFAAYMDFILGIVTMVIAFQKTNLQATPLTIGLTILFVISGVLIEFAVTLVFQCIMFLTPSSGYSPLWAAYWQIIMVIQKYPLSIFAPFVRILLTCVLPVAFINYYPSLLLLGKQGGQIGWLSPLVAVLSVAIAYLFFRFSLKRYTSTGN